MPSQPLRDRVRSFAGPIGEAIASAGIPANAVTLAGLALAGGAALLLARGAWLGAFALLLASSLCDLLDGAVARARGGTGSPMGAALDSTADRYGEALILVGILVNRLENGAPQKFIWLWAAALIGSFLVSYVRARAEGLGLRCDVGILERPERLVLLMLLCLLGPRASALILAVLAVGCHVTFIQRLVHVRSAARARGGGG